VLIKQYVKTWWQYFVFYKFKYLLALYVLTIYTRIRYYWSLILTKNEIDCQIIRYKDWFC